MTADSAAAADSLGIVKTLADGRAVSQGTDPDLAADTSGSREGPDERDAQPQPDQG